MAVALPHDVLVGAEPVPHCTNTHTLVLLSFPGPLRLRLLGSLTQVDVEAEQVGEQHGRQQGKGDGDGGQAGNDRGGRAEGGHGQEHEPYRRVVPRCNTVAAVRESLRVRSF